MSPAVSIGLPVFNGANYLERAIESVLGQTFGDFELLISDNASDDRTPEICRHYAALDQRISYTRHHRNRGPAANYNSVFVQATGEYFCWLAHDDSWASTFLERCVTTLDEQRDVVLTFANVLFVDADDVPVDKMALHMRTDSPTASERFYDTLMVWHDCLPVFGVIRRDALSRTGLIRPYVSGDHVLLGELALLGRFDIATDHLFISRRHQQQSNKQFNVWVDHHAYNAWFSEPDSQHPVSFPQWKLASDLMATAARADLPAAERARCGTAVLRWVLRYRRLMLKDLTTAGRRAARPSMPPNQTSP
jgi:glycosyltransferase involved in cell wall biosynthesis